MNIGGIYKIECTVTNKVYVGSAKNFNKRRRRHIKDLCNNTHHNVHLQRAYNKYGPTKFKFYVIRYSGYEKRSIIELEDYYIAKYNSKNPKFGYNIADASYGDTLSNHPNKAAIIKKRTKTIIKRNRLKSKEELSKIYGKFGSRNGMYNPFKPVYLCKCGVKIQKNAVTCFACRDTSGKNNPFYGKQHTPETKAKISKTNKDSIPPNRRKVIVDGNIYESIHECSVELGVVPATIIHRIKSNNHKYSGYHYVNPI